MSDSSIVIYTSRRQLELYEGNRLIRRYPIAVGKKATPTPHGHYYIAAKHLHPGGVFGSRWMGLSLPTYGIHGTNSPSSIGQAISKGCIRMHNHDAEALYQHVVIGTPVTIQP
ncbi:L,D-transpeptidase [Desulfosporosinus sp. PR]|uniref:L,D-transpeptidase n=1 Tax=Candidatus Desulfosporosinus nitrosoreducens TaxID=3401928 RepID=UPI0027E608E2|nr:L,D-transpeptidase [Desulfosporosinus sp. PR]MDQ7092778.1 L,D-transpeptidase [Desulfosporosinus sp. PR]